MPVFRFPFSVLRYSVVTLALAVASAPAWAQHQPAAPAHNEPEAHQAAPQQPSQQPGVNQQFGKPLADQSSQPAGEHGAPAHGGAAGHGEHEEDSHHKLEAELKASPSVQWLAGILHISVGAAYWVAIILDFAVLAALLIWALKKNLPGAFRSRTSSIQRAMEEARKASEEANRRLLEIETRLSRLSEEVAGMRKIAEEEAAAEERRILAAAEEERRRIVQAAEAEIGAAAKIAQRELKAYAAGLAVSLAERRIRVDAETDRELVRSFAQQLTGSDSHGAKPGKDGQ
ncbi:MAG: ATPase [Terriglobales bacterium]